MFIKAIEYGSHSDIWRNTEEGDTLELIENTGCLACSNKLKILLQQHVYLRGVNSHGFQRKRPFLSSKLEIEFLLRLLPTRTSCLFARSLQFGER